MRFWRFLSLAFLAVVGSLGLAGPASAGTPPGFRVSGRQLLEANGTPFIMRGVNHAHAWFQGDLATAIPAIKATRANVVRVVMATGNRWPETSDAEITQILNILRTNRLIGVLEVHDCTGYSEQAGSVALSNATAFWIRHRSVLMGTESCVIINIANEPHGNNTTAQWQSDHITAIQALRSNGFQHALMVDAPNWGQDWSNSMRGWAGAVLAADTYANVIFSVHMYDVYDTAAEVNAYIDGFWNDNRCLVVGEFAADHGAGTNVDEAAIMARCQMRGYGYMGWSWKGNGAPLTGLDIAVNWNGTPLTTWGTRLIEGTDGIRATSVEATGCWTAASSPTRSPTRTHSPSATRTRTPTPPAFTSTSTRSPTPSHTRTATRTSTPVPPTLTRTGTGTPTRTATPTPPPPTLTRSPTGTMTGTGTPTRTATPTAVPPTLTRSPTGTMTGTGTQTRTATATAVPPTLTRTGTGSFTRSPTGTTTGTPTSSPSGTATVVPSTLTATRTATGTATLTGTRSATPTPTQTLVPPTLTATPTATGTASSSVTLTATRSATPLPTLTITQTESPVPPLSSPTATLTQSTLPTLSFTPTATGTATPSVTSTGSPSVTLTATGSATPLPTLTPTQTRTAVPPSSTLSWTPTASRTSTRTATLTATPVLPQVAVAVVVGGGPALSSGGFLIEVGGTDFAPGAVVLVDGVPAVTQSSIGNFIIVAIAPAHAAGPAVIRVQNPGPLLSASFATLAYVDATPTPTSTVTATATVTQTATRTVSPTATPSATAQSTGTLTRTMTCTVTLTPLPAQSTGPVSVLKVVPLPNPNPKELRLLLEGTADRVRIRVWSRAFNLMAEESFAGPLGPGWTAVSLPSDLLKNAHSGGYFATVTAYKGEQPSAKVPAAKWVVLK